MELETPKVFTKAKEEKVSEPKAAKIISDILTYSENVIPVKVMKLNPNAILPTQGSDAAAGWDVYAALSAPIEIPPHNTVKVGTGLAMEINENYWIGIFARSGLATKEGLRPANCVGVVDPDYRGEIIVALHNDSTIPHKITPGEKIGQLVVIPKFNLAIEEVDHLSNTNRGSGGFGSTGK